TIKINEERLLNEFLELVQIDSETKDEANIANVLKDKFTKLGLDVVEDDAKEKTGHGAGNLICTMKGNKQAVDPIYFTSHMDTVVQSKRVKPSIKDDDIAIFNRLLHPFYGYGCSRQKGEAID